MNGNKVFGLIGSRLSHSRSPQIHAMLGCKGYALYELEEKDLYAFLHRDDIGMLNVTIPYKKTVLTMCDKLTKRAKAIGSVNTVVRCADGTLLGDNTDAGGFSAMAKRAGISLKDKKILIFGSGGAQLAVRYVCLNEGSRSVVTVSRTGTDNYENLANHADAELLVNATPVGTFPDDCKAVIDISLFPKCSGVLDLVYNPPRTVLFLQAKALGIPCSCGLPMLVAQARAAQELFSSKSIGTDKDESILRKLFKDDKNIVLIGMPGCGKTTVGNVLARITGRRAIDTDTEAERLAGMSVQDIFRKNGEKAFREYEAKAIRSASLQRGVIIMTGGGAVTSPQNLLPLRCSARVYHIERATDELPVDGRPLSRSGSISELYAKRLPLYRLFRDTTVINDVSPDITAKMIWRDFCENSCD